ncbi:FAD/NAD(P)-binding protein [Xenorhabdus siamensis]|uniref:FAD/NAD(P)-binding protein n=1 Tax=Xenorhabdus siamensis TaxID=3136254 RepID=UPI0030F40E8F
MINIAIIGGGPNGMYTLNGLLDIANSFPDEKIAITIFDKYGNFGSGWAHSPHQPKTSMLNRIVGQISYSPDCSNPQYSDYSNSTSITFSQWCRKKYKLTNNERYNKKNDEFPTRELYGESLFEIFNELVREFSNIGVKVDVVTEEIVKITKNIIGGYFVETQNALEKNIFDIVILATGHQESKNNFFLAKELNERIEYYTNHH